jgi:hypothetical protein
VMGMAEATMPVSLECLRDFEDNAHLQFTETEITGPSW